MRDELVKELDKAYDSIPQEVLMGLVEMEQPNKIAMLLAAVVSAIGCGELEFTNVADGLKFQKKTGLNLEN